jgi:hypothetical protein
MGARCGISRFVKRLVVATFAVSLVASALTGPAMAELGLPSPVGAGDGAQQSAAGGATAPPQLSAPVAAVAQTAADASDPVVDAASAAVHPSDTADAVAATAPVTQASASSVQPVTTAAASVAVPVAKAAEPVTASAAPAVTGATKPITSSAAPVVTEVTKPLAPVTEPLAAAADQVARPLVESTEPLLAPVAPILAPAVSELTEPLAPVTKTILPAGAATPAVSGETAAGAPRAASFETATPAAPASPPARPAYDASGGASVAGMAVSLVPSQPVDTPRARVSPGGAPPGSPGALWAGTAPPRHEVASARQPDPLQWPLRGNGDTGVSFAVGSGAGIAILLAALAAGLLLAAPGLGRRLRPRLAPWRLPTLHLSLERPG